MNWISINDRMPKLKKYSEEQSESELIEVKLSDGSEHIAWYNTQSGWENMTNEFDNVTHWRNLPK